MSDAGNASSSMPPGLSLAYEIMPRVQEEVLIPRLV